MAAKTATPSKTNKTTFLTDYLKKHPKANASAVNGAWAKAGNPGRLSPSLVGKLRSKLGLAGNIRAKPGASVKPATAKKEKPAKAKPSPKEVTPSVTTSIETIVESKEATPSPQGKSSFIEQVLVDDPRANATDVNEAWKAAGMEGTISGSLVNKLRSELGLAGNRGRGPKPAAKKTRKKREQPKPEAVYAIPAQSRKRRPGSRDEVLVEVERMIDALIFKLMGIDDIQDIEDSLRDARRLLYGGFRQG